nr:immunoglobulin heavy chain junction region [Mus musculus]
CAEGDYVDAMDYW